MYYDVEIMGTAVIKAFTKENTAKRFTVTQIFPFNENTSENDEFLSA
jgi:hypothetical protein